jgi:hypothetical protein
MILKALLAAWVFGLPLLALYPLEAKAQPKQVPCRFAGDGIVDTSTGKQIKDWQIADFKLISRYRSDETGICTLLTDTSEYKWIYCITDNNGNYADAEYYERYSQFQAINGEVQEAIKSNYPFCQRCSPQDVDRWHGGCKVKIPCIPVSTTQYKGAGDALGFNVDDKGNVSALLTDGFPECGVRWLQYGAINRKQIMESGSIGYWTSESDVICFFSYTKVDRTENGIDYQSGGPTLRKVFCVNKR